MIKRKMKWKLWVYRDVGGLNKGVNMKMPLHNYITQTKP